MNKNDNSVLLVEDNQKHLEDALIVLDKFGLSYDVSSNLADALGCTNEKKYNGILSDVFFPISELGIERSSGVMLCEYALEQYIPIVLCTSTYHHGPKTSQINRYAKRQGIPLVDSNEVENDQEADKKEWDSAVLELLIQQAIMENSDFIIQKKELNNLVLEGDVYSDDHLTNVTCNLIAKKAIETVLNEYRPLLDSLQAADPYIGVYEKLSMASVNWKVRMKLPHFAENHGSCREYRIDFIVSEDYNRDNPNEDI